MQSVHNVCWGKQADKQHITCPHNDTPPRQMTPWTVQYQPVVASELGEQSKLHQQRASTRSAGNVLTSNNTLWCGVGVWGSEEGVCVCL